MNAIDDVLWSNNGLLDYDRVLELQRKAVSLVDSGAAGEFYFFLEHYPVYTAGIHFRESVYDPSVRVLKIQRGGGITFHGPGQLVVYPVVSLSRRAITIRDLIELMHDSVIETLTHYGIQAESRLNSETGVWVGNSKISSTGFYIKGSTTMHGFALNVNTDLSYFRKINPCGYDPEIMTSMEKELHSTVRMEEIRELLWKNIRVKMKIDQFREIGGTDYFMESEISGRSSGTAP